MGPVGLERTEYVAMSLKGIIHMRPRAKSQS